MNIFVSTTFLPDGEKLYLALSKCRDAGIESVEIGSNHCYENNYEYINEFSFKFLIHNYFPIPKNSFVLNIASFNDTTRKRSIKHIKKAIDLCKKIGAELYTFHPGFLTDPKGSNISKKNYDFQWDDNQLKSSNYDKAKSLMYNSLDEVIKYATDNNVSIAIETEGSIAKKNHLLMQRPDEYKEFVSKYNPSKIGINLNIGHLNLAANSFAFSKSKFVDLIQNHIVAMELSHNNGIEDQHLPLELDSWYWDLINDSRYKYTYKILEYRNTSIERILNDINNIKKNY